VLPAKVTVGVTLMPPGLAALVHVTIEMYIESEAEHMIALHY
jgi:hypothetical protein